MKKANLFLIACIVGLKAQASDILGSYQCKLAYAPANALDSQSQPFPLLTLLDDRYEAAETDSSPLFELIQLTPSQGMDLPALGGPYFKGGNEYWVIVDPTARALPMGVDYEVLKPFEYDPYTGAVPKTYFCRDAI